jgi:hypothetical protein
MQEKRSSGISMSIGREKLSGLWSHAAHAQPQTFAAAAFVEVGIANELQHRLGVGTPSRGSITTRQARLGRELAARIKLPHFLRQRTRQPIRREARKKSLEIVDVA